MTETRDSAVTAAELDELQKRARHWSWDGHPNVQALLTELADANAALRRERDEALMQASGDKIILARALDQAGADAEHDEKVIEALRASNAKKDAALRKIAGLDYKNAATNMAAYKAVQIATDALTPASQEADHVADAGKMASASQEAPASPAEKAQAIMDDWRENRPGDWVGDKEYWEAPASPSPGLRQGSATINAGKGHAAGLPPYALSRPVSEREDGQ